MDYPEELIDQMSSYKAKLDSIDRAIGGISWTEMFSPQGSAPCKEHRADGLRADYIDGVFVSYCKNCGDKLVFETVPGNLPKVKINQLLADLMQGKAIDLEQLNLVHAALLLERDLLEGAESKMRLIQQMLLNQYEDRVSSTKQPAVDKRHDIHALGGEEEEVRSLA